MSSFCLLSSIGLSSLPTVFTSIYVHYSFRLSSSIFLCLQRAANFCYGKKRGPAFKDTSKLEFRTQKKETGHMQISFQCTMRLIWKNRRAQDCGQGLANTTPKSAQKEPSFRIQRSILHECRKKGGSFLYIFFEPKLTALKFH